MSRSGNGLPGNRSATLLSRSMAQELLDQPAWCTDGSSGTVIDSALPELSYDFAVREIHRASTGAGPPLFVHDDGAWTSAVIAGPDIAGYIPDRAERNLELQWKSGEGYGRSFRLHRGFECDGSDFVHGFDRAHALANGNVDVCIPFAFVGMEQIIVGAESSLL